MPQQVFGGLKKDSIRRQAQRSSKWLENKLKNLKTARKTRKPMIGEMCLFIYDAKGKDVLPFWDSHPLIFVIERYPDGILGLNLHYLPPILRKKLFTALVNAFQKKERKRLQISYNILTAAMKSRLFAPTIKRYLYSHLKSSFVVIPQEEWDFTVTLPLARWNNSGAGKVYKDSRQKAR